MARSSKRTMRSSRRSRPSRRPVRRARTVSKTVKRYVKAAIHRNIENKVVVSNLANQTITTAGTAIQPFTINCLPTIGEGSEQGERIGLQIKPMVCTIRGFINMKPHNSATNPYMPIKVKMWLASYKVQNRNATALQLADFARFFEAGNTSVPFQGNMLDMVLPVNKADWTVYETRLINLGLTSNSTAYSGSGFTYDNSRFSVPFSFNVGKHLKQRLMYDDASTSRPTNRNMYVIIQAVSAEGSSGGNVFQTCEVHYSHRFEFEDA